MVDPYNACSSRSTRLFHFTPRHCDWLIVIVCVYANCQLQAYSSRTSLIWWWVIADVEEEEEKNGLSLHTTSIFTSKWLLIYIYIIYRTISVCQLLRDYHCVAHKFMYTSWWHLPNTIQFEAISDNSTKYSRQDYAMFQLIFLRYAAPSCYFIDEIIET